MPRAKRSAGYARNGRSFAGVSLLFSNSREPHVLVQLPRGKMFDPLEEMCKTFGENVTVFRDPDSTNGPALKNLFQLSDC